MLLGHSNVGNFTEAGSTACFQYLCLMFSEIKNLIAKELLLEWRTQYAFSGILLYVIATVFICYLSFKNIVDVPTWNALFWIILLFASVNAVAKSFLMESKGRLLYFYTLASPQAIILSKTIYNMLLMLLLSLVCFGFYTLFIGNAVQNVALFSITLVLGSIGFASTLTMVSSIASKTNNNFTLMAILGFPILMPLLLTLIQVSKNAIDGLAMSVSWKYILVLSLLDIIVITLSCLLFPYLWRD